MSKKLEEPDRQANEEERNLYRPFTRESLAAIGEQNGKQKKKRAEGKPDANLEQGLQLPMRMHGSFPPELASTPLEDIDPYYHNQRTFVVISKGKYIFRFSATNALWILNPFNPIRKLAINILTNPLFSFIIFTTILINCILMIMPKTPTIDSSALIFTGIYTFEMVVKIIARGLILQPFTYLRNAWGWLEFIIVISGYMAIGIDIENLSFLVVFRILRALQTMAIFPGSKTIVGAVIESLKNLREVIILTVFSLTVFAVISLQIYMGVLTQKCIREFPHNDDNWGNATDENWEAFCQNETNWYEENGFYPLCGNSSGAGQCKPGYICLQGYGPNPDYGYTSFDNFGWAFLSAFRLMTLDYWESVYQMVLRSAGPWHALFFVMIIFLCSFYLLNLILAIVVMSYNDMQKKTKERETEDKAVTKKIKNKDETINLNQSNGDSIELSQQPDVANRKEDKDDTTHKRKLYNWFMKGIDLFCIWDCGSPWVEFQKLVGLLALDPFFELFIVLCIIMNTLFMALDHHDMDRDMERMLKTGNYFFTATFVVEATLKIIAMSPRHYFAKGWNIFDFTIVVLALSELVLEGAQGLSVLRMFRLLRILRLAKYKNFWPTLNRIITIMGRSMGAFSNLSCILCIIVYMFAIAGMQLFGKNYIDYMDRFPEGELPRWNFTDFMHSFMIVFRALCGEWIESMWDCMLVGDITCILFFVTTVVICNFVVLKLFLALLLPYFVSSSETTPTADDDSNKIGKAFNRISRMCDWMKCSTKSDVQKSDGKDKSETIVMTNEDEDDAPAYCCPTFCYQQSRFMANNDQSSFWRSWASIRLKTIRLIENTYFETIVLTVILISSLALALEDVHLSDRPHLKDILYYVDRIVTILFFIEMLIKWLGFGFKKYFTDGWCLLDFIVVMAMLINFTAGLCGAGSIQALKTMRALRALRPLRAMSHIPSMRVVVNTLIQAIPSIFNVLLVCLFFWLFFAIMGVQLFAGKFFKCVDMNYTTLNYEIIPDRLACLNDNYTWENSPMNFDDIGNAYLSLFQVATFKGWIQIMNDAIDSRQVGQQPIREVNIYMYLYFVIFIIFGSFFTLNLFVGVIIDNFNQQKKKDGGNLELFMTENQKKYHREMKRMGSKKPSKAIPKPKVGLSYFSN